MISVIVPVYGVEPYLRRALDSIPVADDIEVIVIDDGSKDGCGAICDEYADRFTVIHQENAGVAAARNRGLDEAHGEWVTFLDSDDHYAEHAFDAMRKAIGKHPDAKVIQFNHYRYYAVIGKTALKYTNPAGSYRLGKRPRLWEYVWNKLYRRDFIEQHGIREPVGLQFGDDEIFVLRCMFEAPVTCVDAVTVVHCFENPDAITKTMTRKKILAHHKAFMAFLHEFKPDTDEGLRRRKAILDVLANHCRSDWYAKFL